MDVRIVCEQFADSVDCDPDDEHRAQAGRERQALLLRRRCISGIRFSDTLLCSCIRRAEDIEQYFPPCGSAASGASARRLRLRLPDAGLLAAIFLCDPPEPARTCR